jgi:hypothetical protein
MAVTLHEMREADGGNFAEKMDAGGITDEKLIEILKEKIEAKETKPFNDKGQIIYSKPLEAHDIQLKAVDMSLKLKGRYPTEKRHHTFEGGVPIVPLTEEQEIELEAMKEIIRQRARKKEP